MADSDDDSQRRSKFRSERHFDNSTTSSSGYPSSRGSMSGGGGSIDGGGDRRYGQGGNNYYNNRGVQNSSRYDNGGGGFSNQRSRGDAYYQGGGGGYGGRSGSSPGGGMNPSQGGYPYGKRMRMDWPEERGYGGGMNGGRDRDPYASGGPPYMRGELPPPRGPTMDDHHRGNGPPSSHYGGAMSRSTSYSGGGGGAVEMTAPNSNQVMSFKSFLATQDDTISDDDAMKKYSEYKLEFKRQQLNEFFVAHKDEEWFRWKYHPEDSVKRHEEQRKSVLRRLDIFQQFVMKDNLEAISSGKLSVDVDNQDNLIRLFDSIVIMLEGGDQHDFTVLDEEEEARKAAMGSSFLDSTSSSITSTSVNDSTTKNGGDAKSEETGEIKNKEESESTKTTDVTSVSVNQNEESTKDEELLNGESGKSEGTGEKEEKKEKTEEELSCEKAKQYLSNEKVSPNEINGNEDNSTENRLKRKRSSTNDENNPDDDLDKNGDDDELPPGAKASSDDGGNKKEGDSGVERSNKDSSMTDEKDVEKLNDASNSDAVCKQSDKNEKGREHKARALHRTASIFLRNLPPTITRLEVETMCKKFPGFLRAAIADPQPERRFFRRGWVTFERDVRIKEICYALNSVRLRDCEIGPIINRDIARRIRTVNGLACDRKVVRNDIKLAVQLMNNFDKKWDLFQKKKSENLKSSDESGMVVDGGEKESEKIHSDDKASEIKEQDDLCPEIDTGNSNPILANITDYLIEEASAEEDELLGKNNESSNGCVLEDGEDSDQGSKVMRDLELISVLDRLILYLRIVHSVDFYNHCEYPNEDAMPNRIGLIHARGIPPVSNVSKSEIEEYCAAFSRKMTPFSQVKIKLTSEEISKIGAKTEEKEVEKFIEANTQELAKDKWLCPLSGKKFKGPDFIRKHIFNKHMEKLEEVKCDVAYFNNFLSDSKRPQTVDPSAPMSGSGNGGGGHHNSSSSPHPPPLSHRSPHLAPSSEALHRDYRAMDGGGGGIPRYGGDPHRYGDSVKGGPGGGPPMREATSYPVYTHSYNRQHGGGGMSDPRSRGGPDPRGMEQMQSKTRYNTARGRTLITYRDLDAPTDDF